MGKKRVTPATPANPVTFTPAPIDPDQPREYQILWTRRDGGRGEARMNRLQDAIEWCEYLNNKTGSPNASVWHGLTCYHQNGKPAEHAPTYGPRFGDTEHAPPKPLKYWHGGMTCDACEQIITDTLYDAASTNGQWGTFCHRCWTEYTTMRLGTGSGQKYAQQPDGRFAKVEG